MAYAECIWPTSGNAVLHKMFVLDRPEKGSRHPCRVVPDGCVDLTFEITEFEAKPYIFGSSTQVYDFETQVDAGYIGIRFRPGVAPVFDDYQISELTDSHFRLDHVSSLKELGEKLALSVNDWNSRQSLVQSFLQSSVRLHSDAAVTFLVQQILKSDGNVNLKEMFSKVGYSPRQLERLFKKHVGINAKKLSRILRFQKAVELLSVDRPQAQVALECGYFDQAHMINEFQEFVCQSPIKYLS